VLERQHALRATQDALPAMTAGQAGRALRELQEERRGAGEEMEDAD